MSWKTWSSDGTARRRARLDSPGAAAAEIKTRALTNRYNARPAWLANLHAALDRAVRAVCGWDDPEPTAVVEDAVLGRRLALNRERNRT